MLTIIFWILLILISFFLIAFMFEVVVFFLLGAVAMVLWGHGIVWQVIIVTIGIIVLLQKKA
jgi:hypothetical protein